MERAQRHAWRPTFVPCIAVLLIAACGGGDTSGLPEPPAAADSIATLVVSPPVLNLLLGGSGGLAIVALTDDGDTVSAGTIAWTTGSSAIATVTTMGVVTGVGLGTSSVTATVGAVDVSAVVNVEADPTPVALAVTPPTASTTVGESVQFSVVAVSATGEIVPAPALTWSSSTPAIASVTGSGVAQGQAVGVTEIGAAGGGLVAVPAILMVTDDTATTCADIGEQEDWLVTLGFSWARTGVNTQNHRISAEHHGLINNFPMSRVYVDDTVVRISSQSGPWGSGSISDSDTNLGSDPVTVESLAGNGEFARELNGAELPRLDLTIDLAACAYRFDMPVQMEMTLTHSDGTTETAVLALGTLQSGWVPLHPDWREVDLADILEAEFPVHSLGWLISGNATETGYIPFGFGQLLFAGLAGPGEESQGTATVSATFRPSP